MEVVETKTEKSKDGKTDVPVLIVLGKVDKDYIGDFKVSIWKLKVSKLMEDTHTDDTDNWKGLLVTLKATADKKAIEVFP